MTAWASGWWPSSWPGAGRAPTSSTPGAGTPPPWPPSSAPGSTASWTSCPRARRGSSSGVYCARPEGEMSDYDGFRVERHTSSGVARITLGVGLELALACDLRVAADDTVLGLPEITLGMIPGSGGTQRLAHLIGLSRAKDVILRGRRISAADALAWGLVAEVVPLAELDARAEAIALELA